MTVLLFIIALILDVIFLGNAFILLWINNFSMRGEIASRNKTTKRILKYSMFASIIVAFLTGLLSNGENVEQAISLSVFLYYAMAATMMLSIFLACGVIIYRLVNKKTYSETTAKEVSSVIKIAVVGEIISILLAWLLS